MDIQYSTFDIASHVISCLRESVNNNNINYNFYYYFQFLGMISG